MPHLPDHNRKTQAANADLLGDEARMDPPALYPHDRQRDRADAPPAAQGRAPRGGGEGQPGKDINQAGFLKGSTTARP